jgi:hypothetical protein
LFESLGFIRVGFGLPAVLTICFKFSLRPKAAIIAPVNPPLLMLKQISGGDSVTCSWSTGPVNVLHPEIFLISSYWGINLTSLLSEVLAPPVFLKALPLFVPVRAMLVASCMAVYIKITGGCT